MRIANANLMKEINLNNVRQVMKRIKTATKPQLASLTKLSVVTVNSLVKELHELGELIEDLTVPSNGGRPAQTYRYNYNFSLALVMYLKDKEGQVLISATVVNLEPMSTPVNPPATSEERYLVCAVPKRRSLPFA